MHRAGAARRSSTHAGVVQAPTSVVPVIITACYAVHVRRTCPQETVHRCQRQSSRASAYVHSSSREVLHRHRGTRLELQIVNIHRRSLAQPHLLFGTAVNLRSRACQTPHVADSRTNPGTNPGRKRPLPVFKFKVGTSVRGLLHQDETATHLWTIVGPFCGYVTRFLDHLH